MLIHTHNAISISQRPDGYINLTKMAASTGKRIDNWLRSQDTKDLLAEFENQQAFNSLKLRELEIQPALIVKEGRKDGGTWAHPLIAIQFAQHCSPIFALQVSQWVIDFMTGKPTSQPQLSHAKQQRFRAKILILKALTNHLSTSKLSHTKAYRQFIAQYNQQQIQLPDWVYTTKPHISWATLHNWQNLLKAKGKPALIDKHKGKSGRKTN